MNSLAAAEGIRWAVIARCTKMQLVFAQLRTIEACPFESIRPHQTHAPTAGCDSFFLERGKVAMRIPGLVAAYSLPECKLLKVVPVGSHREWLTIPLDGKTLCVAVAGDDAVTVVDNQTLQIVKKIAAGAVPKRNTSGTLHTEWPLWIDPEATEHSPPTKEFV